VGKSPFHQQQIAILWDIMGIATSKIVIKDNSSGGKNGD